MLTSRRNESLHQKKGDRYQTPAVNNSRSGFCYNYLLYQSELASRRLYPMRIVYVQCGVCLSSILQLILPSSMVWYFRNKLTTHEDSFSFNLNFYVENVESK